MYIIFYIHLLAWIFICDHRFHAVCIRKPSGRKNLMIVV